MTDQKPVFEGLDLMLEGNAQLHSCFWTALEELGITFEALQKAHATATHDLSSRERRREANRASAAVSRTRKRARVQDLEARVDALQRQVQELTDANLELRRVLRREDGTAT